MKRLMVRTQYCKHIPMVQLLYCVNNTYLKELISEESYRTKDKKKKDTKRKQNKNEYITYIILLGSSYHRVSEVPLPLSLVVNKVNANYMNKNKVSSLLMSSILWIALIEGKSVQSVLLYRCVKSESHFVYTHVPART